MFPKKSSKSLLDTLPPVHTNGKASCLTKGVIKFKGWVSKYPKTTVGLMITILIINVAVGLWYNHRQPDKASFVLKAPAFKPEATTNGLPEFSIENFMTLSKLKDSLSYLMSKKNKSHEDTLLFIRVFEQYSKIDPSILDQIKN